MHAGLADRVEQVEADLEAAKADAEEAANVSDGSKKQVAALKETLRIQQVSLPLA